jgi:hypothetical protein
MQLVLASVKLRIDDQGKRLSLDAADRHVPGKLPDSIRPFRVFNASYRTERQRQAMHKSGGAATHLDIANRRVAGVKRPYFGVLPAFERSAAS